MNGYTTSLYEFVTQSCYKPGDIIQVNDLMLPDQENGFLLEIPEFPSSPADTTKYDNEKKALFNLIEATAGEPSLPYITKGAIGAVRIQLGLLLSIMVDNKFLQEEDADTFGKYQTLLSSSLALELLVHFGEYLLTDKLKYQELKSVTSALDRASSLCGVSIPPILPQGVAVQSKEESSSSSPSTLTPSIQLERFRNSRKQGLFSEWDKEKFPQIKEFVEQCSAKIDNPLSLEREKREFRAAMLSCCPKFLSLESVPEFRMVESPFSGYSKYNPRVHPHVHVPDCYNFFYVYTKRFPIECQSETPEAKEEGKPQEESVPFLRFVYGYDLATVFMKHENLCLSPHMIGKSGIYKSSMHNLLDSFVVKDKTPSQMAKKKEILDKIFWVNQCNR